MIIRSNTTLTSTCLTYCFLPPTSSLLLWSFTWSIAMYASMNLLPSKLQHNFCTLFIIIIWRHVATVSLRSLLLLLLSSSSQVGRSPIDHRSSYRVSIVSFYTCDKLLLLSCRGSFNYVGRSDLLLNRSRLSDIIIVISYFIIFSCPLLSVRSFPKSWLC